MGEKFEDIEHEQFGEDGFEKAVRQIKEDEYRENNREFQGD